MQSDMVVTTSCSVMREYQRYSSDFIVNKRRVYLADEAGLGKTLSVLDAVVRLGAKRILVTAPKCALYTWGAEGEKWFSLRSIVYTGTVAVRKRLLETFINDCEITILVTTYAMLSEVMNIIKWDALIQDEVHRAGLFNRKSKTWAISAKASRLVATYVAVTGTPIRRDLTDLWPILHIINPIKFASFWNFVNDHCIVTTIGYDRQIEGRPKDVLKFKQLVSTYMVRHKKKDVLTELPSKQRNVVFCDLDPIQLRAYKSLIETMVYEEDNSFIVTPTIIAMITRLRELLVCPRVLDINSDGVAIELVGDMLDDLFILERCAVIFTPYRRAVKHFRSYLMKRFKGIEVYEIHGQLSAQEISLAESRFQHSNNCRRVMICVIRSSTSFQLFKASDCFFIGYEWSAIDNSQAEDRLHRIGQQNNVICNYIVHNNTIDAEVALVLNRKQQAENWVLNSDQVLARIVDEKKQL